VQQALPDGPYAFNLINSPNEPALEQRGAALYLAHNIHIVEASAYVDLTAPLVHFRAAGLGVDATGSIVIKNHIIAKVSRKEVARRFLEPAAADILDQLVKDNKITELQARLALQVPVADDITVEADSGGHTDNRPLVGLLPTMLALRDEIQAKYHYPVPVRIGAAGGVSTPTSALAAFIMGADYVVTGSVNQACVESGATDHTRLLLAQADMADVIMAPAADMFEMGVKVQLLKRGTLFPLRAQKLYELYTRYNSIDEIPTAEREKQERQVFKRDFDSIWDDVIKFFIERDPRQIERAERDPKQKMALIFRWYLGLSSRWAVIGEKGREMDYQIWCGPSMGTFNDWTRPTYLNDPGSRHVVDVALHLLTGAAYLYRLRMLTMQGIQMPASLEAYLPTAPLG
jgi:PfaD family protein